MNTYCLTPTTNRWILTSAGSKKPLAVFRSKDRALEEAIDIASAKEGALEIHYRDGSVATGCAEVTGEGGLHCFPVVVTEDRPEPTDRSKNRHGHGHRRKKHPAAKAA